MSLADRKGRDRLAVAVDATPLLGVRTGVGMFCQGALEALGSRSDTDVAAFAVTWRRRHLLAPLVPAGIRVVQRPMPARPLHRAWARSSLPPVEWFTGPVDVVHGTNYVVPPTALAARVVSVHDLTAVRYPEMCDASTRMFPAHIRRAVAEGAWVHTDSQFVADEVVAVFGADPERVRVVYLGIPEHAPPSAGVSGSTGSSGSSGRDGPSESYAAGAAAVTLPAGTSRYVLALGTVEPRKDLPSLVRAFDLFAADHGDVALVLAGRVGWGDDALGQAIAASPWRHRIVRLGYVDDDVWPDVLGGACVLAYPSVYEGFGFPPLEAMAAGVPVVATAVGAIPEVAGDGALLVAAGDDEALAGALVGLLGDAGARAALIERGRARAQRFTWAACGEGLAQLYSEAARSR